MHMISYLSFRTLFTPFIRVLIHFNEVTRHEFFTKTQQPLLLTRQFLSRRAEVPTFC